MLNGNIISPESITRFNVQYEDFGNDQHFLVLRNLNPLTTLFGITEYHIEGLFNSHLLSFIGFYRQLLKVRITAFPKIIEHYSMIGIYRLKSQL